MKNLLKILPIVLLILPKLVFAQFSVPLYATSTTQGWISPMRVVGVEQVIRAINFYASSTVSNIFPYASTTVTSAQILCLSTDCRSSWPSGASSDWNQQLNFGVLTLTPTTTIPVWIKGNFYASTTALFGGNVGIGNGTTSPQALLSITSTPGSATSTLFAVSTTTSNANQANNTSATPTRFTNDLFKILSNGNVGLGTTSPSGTLSVQGIYSFGTFGLSSSSPPRNVLEVYGGTRFPDTGQNIVLQAGPGGGNVEIVSGGSSNQSGGSVEPGTVTIRGSDVVGSGNSGGGVFIRGGNAAPFTVNGGDVTIRGGNGALFTTNGGNVILDGGTLNSGIGITGSVIMATNNGNVGVGDATPVALFTVGASDAFQINSSGRVLGNVGASGAGNLSYSFVGDTNNGWYQAGADTQRWQTSGADRMALVDTGLGIGTTTPSPLYNLGVRGDVLANLFVGSRFLATSTTASVFPYASSTALTATTLFAPISSTILLSATSTMGLGTTTYKFSGFAQASDMTEWGCISSGTGNFTSRVGNGTASSTFIVSGTGGTTSFTSLTPVSFLRGVAVYIDFGSVVGAVSQPTCSYTRVTK